MQRVYLLLRNNLESGPFTIDELRQQHLTDSDLIWVEGKSSAWAYPSELEELTSFSIESSKPSGNRKSNIYADPGEIEERAEELRKRALSYTPQSYYSHPVSDPAEKYQSIVLPGEEEIEMVYHRRRGSANLSQYVAAAMLALFLGVGWYQRGLLFNASSPNSSPVNARVVSTESNLAKRPAKQIQAPAPAVVAVTDSTLPAIETSLTSIPKKQKRTEITSTTEDEPVIAAVEPPVINEPGGEALEKKEETETTPVVQPPVPTVKSETETSPKEAVETDGDKKKGIGQALKSIFKKKKRDEDKATEAVKTVAEDNG